MLPLRRFPDWSFGAALSSIFDTDTTSFVVPGSNANGTPGFHPDLVSTTLALEVQRRWDQDSQVHPIGTVSAGGLLNTYSCYETRGGVETLHEYGKTWVRFAQVAWGAEVNVTKWMRATAMLGYRSGGRMTIRLASGSNGGMTTMLNVELGKF
jgi:hypothetical protein